MSEADDRHAPTEDQLRAELEAARPEAEPPAGDPPPAPGGGGRRPRPGRPRGEIFDGSPVRALGVYGDQHYFLDTRGQLRSLAGSFQKNAMLSIFGGRAGLLGSHFPQFDRNGDPKHGDFNQLKLATAMMQATEERGVWSPTGRVRGPGAWTDEDGQLIWHAGDGVLIDGDWHEPGVYEGHVYPASDPVPRPADTAPQGDPAAEVLELFETWNWSRPDVDPVLALGAVCAQMLGGALEWRPVTWLTGDRSTGKSTFQRTLLYLHGGRQGLLQSSDATEAGVRSVIGYSCLPVSLDELEPDDDPKKGKAAAIIRLARIAASGDQTLRGSADQKGYQGNAFSCFLFSSILVPPMPSQDRSRLILLNFDRLSNDAPKPKDEPRRLRRLGAALRRLLIDRWGEWPERLELWRAALGAIGHGGRQADNYGTVLALADLVLHQRAPSSEVLDGWAAKLASWLADEAEDTASNAEDMLVHLMSQPLDVWRRGQRFNVGTWLAMAARLDGAPEEIEAARPENANSYLAQFGLRVKGTGLDAQLLIANKPLVGLASLFDGTPWAAGVWSQAARRVPGAQATKTCFARISSRAYAVPFRAIPGLLNTMDETGRGTPPGAVSSPPDAYEDWR